MERGNIKYLLPALSQLQALLVPPDLPATDTHSCIHTMPKIRKETQKQRKIIEDMEHRVTNLEEKALVWKIFETDTS